MKKTIKIISMLLCMMMLASMLCACALYDDKDKEAKKSDAAASDTSEKDNFTKKELATPVITIGKYEVTLEKYIEFYEQIKSYYAQSYGYDITETGETLSQYIDLITEALTKEKMVLYRADELGLTDLTDEQNKEITEGYEKDLKEMEEYYTDLAESEAASDSTIDINAKVEEYILDEAKYYCGEGATLEQYKEYLREQAYDKFISDLLFDEIVKNIEVSDEDIKTWYDKSAADDEEYFTEHPETYKDECDSYESTGFISDGKTKVEPLYVPEGYSRVYHILITKNVEKSETYNDNIDKMQELEDEYGTLAFELAMNGSNKTAKARMSDILDEYEKLEAANTKELETLYKSARQTANNAFRELEKGSDFKDVMKEFSQDSSFENKATLEKGKLISLEYTSQADWSEAVKAEFKKLKKGEYSKVFVDSDGCHILYYIDDVDAGVISRKDAKTQISDNLISEKQQTEYDSVMEKWLKDEDKIVVVDGTLISKIGH